MPRGTPWHQGGRFTKGDFAQFSPQKADFLPNPSPNPTPFWFKTLYPITIFFQAILSWFHSGSRATPHIKTHPNPLVGVIFAAGATSSTTPGGKRARGLLWGCNGAVAALWDLPPPSPRPGSLLLFGRRISGILPRPHRFPAPRLPPGPWGCKLPGKSPASSRSCHEAGDVVGAPAVCSGVHRRSSVFIWGEGKKIIKNIKK